MMKQSQQQINTENVQIRKLENLNQTGTRILKPGIQETGTANSGHWTQLIRDTGTHRSRN